MTPEAQQITIAEACGWEAHETQHVWFWYKPGTFPKGATPSYQLPDYLTDLNAMHEAEKMLTMVQASRYGRCLAVIAGRMVKFNEDVQIGPLDVYAWATLTAAQRAEAFLKTLNLWTDKPRTTGAEP